MMAPMTRRQFGFLTGLGLTAGLRAQRYDEMGIVPERTAGFAETDITPELGMERPGNYGKVFHRKFFDPCKVRAAVFGSGDERVALVGLDALVIPREVVVAARARIERETGMAGEAVMIAASHSHSSGPTGMVLPGEYDHADEFVRRLAYEWSSEADGEYLKLVEDRIVEAVVRADAARRPAAVGFGFGTEEAAAFNRRFRMKNGLTYTHPRQGNPEIVEAAGPIDPQVGVTGAWDEHGRLRGCIVNFACHATAGPSGISANWIYWMEKVIRGAYGSDVVVVFLPAPNGDVTQVDNVSPHVRLTGVEGQRMVGGLVGAEAVKTLLQVYASGDWGQVAHVSETLRLKRRRPSAERVAEAMQIARGEPDPSSAEWAFAKETVLLDALLRKSPETEAEVQAIQVGPAVFVASPAEYFVEYGLRIKRESPFPFTFPIELANGVIGYVPTLEAFGEHGGGYETRLTSYSNLQIDAGDRIAEASIALTKKLTPGRVAEPPPAGEFRGPWSYGDLGPQVE